ncbi:DNA polymerase [Vibrio splendidus]
MKLPVTAIIDGDSLLKNSNNEKSFIMDFTLAYKHLFAHFSPMYIGIVFNPKHDLPSYIGDAAQALGVDVVTDGRPGTTISRIRNGNGTDQKIIVTSEIHYCQLLNDTTKILDAKLGKVLDKFSLKEALGLTPEEIPAFLALAGLPGRPDSRIVTMSTPDITHFLSRPNATTVLSDPGVTSNVSLPAAIQNKRQELAKRLGQMTIPIPSGGPDLDIGQSKRMKLDHIYSIFSKSGNFSLLPDTFRIYHGYPLDALLYEPALVLSETNIESVINSFNIEGSVLVDTLNEGTLITVKNECYWCPINSPLNYQLYDAISSLEEDVHVVTVDLMNSLRFCKTNNLPLLSSTQDLISSAYYLDSQLGRMTLSERCMVILNVDPNCPELSLINKPVSKDTASTMSNLGARSRLTQRSNRVAYSMLTQRGCLHGYQTIELPAIKCFFSMESLGICLSKDKAESTAQQLLKDKQSVIQSISQKYSFNNFNSDTPNILSDMGKRAGLETNQIPTQMHIGKMEELLDRVPDFNQMIRIEKINNILRVNIEPMVSRIDPLTDRIFTTIKQFHTKTGRISTEKPTLLNLPARGEDSGTLREMYQPTNGFKYYSADYSQIELMILAHLSGDEKLIYAFINGVDIHALTASEILGIPIEDVSESQRKSAKAINFGLIYGQGAYGLANKLGIPQSEAESFILTYFERFPAVLQYLDGQISFAREHGYIETITNRRVYIDNLNSAESKLRSAAERKVKNAPMQGSAADLIKKAMVECQEMLLNINSKSRMFMQIHDELIFEIHESEYNKIPALINDTMLNTLALKVPLKVDGVLLNSLSEKDVYNPAPSKIDALGYS